MRLVNRAVRHSVLDEQVISLRCGVTLLRVSKLAYTYRLELYCCLLDLVLSARANSERVRVTVVAERGFEPLTSWL